MADLYKREHREDWLKWAIEFMQRGIWPEEPITVHGPHPGADLMWGEMSEYTFQTSNGIRGIHDVRGVRIKDFLGQSYGLLRTSEMQPKERKWLRAARRALAKLRKDRERERLLINSPREKGRRARAAAR